MSSVRGEKVGLFLAVVSVTGDFGEWKAGLSSLNNSVADFFFLAIFPKGREWLLDKRTDVSS